MIAYFLTQRLVSSNVLSAHIPEQVVRFLPIIAGAVVFILSSKWQQAQMAKQTGKLVGQEAPDFDIEFKDDKTTLKKLLATTALPTVVDFYQNF